MRYDGVHVGVLIMKGVLAGLVCAHYLKGMPFFGCEAVCHCFYGGCIALVLIIVWL